LPRHRRGESEAPEVTRKSKRTIYIVLHHEIMDFGGGEPRDDEMVFYVVSSFAKAIARIKASGVSPYSWWEIQKQILDDPNCDTPEHVGYYGLKGGKLKSPPYEKCIEIFKRKVEQR
jgi:hypothetical protein